MRIINELIYPFSAENDMSQFYRMRLLFGPDISDGILHVLYQINRYQIPDKVINCHRPRDKL